MSHLLLPEILKMSPVERIALADAIYESFDDTDQKHVSAHRERQDATMLPGQKAELERRIAYYETHPELLVPAEKVLAKLKRAP